MSTCAPAYLTSVERACRRLLAGRRHALSGTVSALAVDGSADRWVMTLAGGGQVGLAERVMGVAQASWPLAVTVSCRLNRPRARMPPGSVAGVCPQA